MKKYLLFLLLFPFNPAFAQEFPANFAGEWEGELLWFKKGNPVPQKINMQLKIFPDTAGNYAWQIIYGDANTDARPYTLKPVNITSGHWQIDENNGIILDQFWSGNRFSGSFSILNSIITNSYYLENGDLHVEFYSFETEPLNTTGGKDPGIPSVQSYSMKSFQKAILSKRN